MSTGSASRHRFGSRFLAVLAALAALVVAGCQKEAPPKGEPPAPAARRLARDPLTGGPFPALLVTQAQFDMVAGEDGKKKPVPGPAKLTFVRKTDQGWTRAILEDPDSNVFHKAITVDEDGDGTTETIYTIGATRALLKLWQFAGGAWRSRALFSASYGGKFDRFRDLEIGDVDGDGTREMVIATHDQGAIEVVEKVGEAWESRRIDQKPETFVHEIELGDVDGDGRIEIFATPSHPNKADMVSQPGEVVMFRFNLASGAFDKTLVESFEKSHAKEILAVDLRGKGVATLFSVVEAETKQDGAGTAIVQPVQIRRYSFGKGGQITATVAATLQDRQCRFLTPGDLDGDGRIDLVAAAMKTGLWLLREQEDGTFAPSLIDAASSGYEHAALAADLEGDGKTELYVASDEQGELRRYDWDGTGFRKTVLAPINPGDITWNLTAGRL